MSKLNKAVRSRGNWTVVAIFLIAGFEGISGLIPGAFLTPILGFLTFVAAWLKVNPSQNYSE